MRKSIKRRVRVQRSSAVFMMQAGLCVAVLAAVMLLKVAAPQAYPTFSQGYQGQMERHLTLEDLNRALERLMTGEQDGEEGLADAEQATPVFNGEKEKGQTGEEERVATTNQSWVFLDVTSQKDVPTFSQLSSSDMPFEVSPFEPSMLVSFEETEKPVYGALAWPAKGPVSSPFGYRIHPLTKKRSFHTGIDIAASGGSDIVSAAAGQVYETGYNDVYGNYMIIKHGDSFYTFYGHCRKLIKEEGERVGKGETVALVGTTGWSTGNHLHFEVRYQGKQIDPQQFY
ncbi:MAG: M23 family metallopeptidase [Clostridia bacterium]|nr:M23 family metallopeptidase [Clostridia bacterium]